MIESTEVNGRCFFGSKDPFHTADWRYLRARYLVETNGRPGPYDDQRIGVVREYLKALARSRGEAARRSVRTRWPHLGLAHELHENAGILVDEIQARLLAGQTFDAIAAKTGVPVSVLRAYEATFFDVAEHLQGMDWLMENVLQKHLWTPSTLTPAQTWKWIALAMGPVGLELLIAADLGKVHPDDHAQQRNAEVARYCVRDAVTPMTPANSLKIVTEGAQLLGFVDAKGRPKFRHDPMLNIMYASLRMMAKKPPSPKRQRKQKPASPKSDIASDSANAARPHH